MQGTRGGINTMELDFSGRADLPEFLTTMDMKEDAGACRVRTCDPCCASHNICVKSSLVSSLKILI